MRSCSEEVQQQTNKKAAPKIYNNLAMVRTDKLNPDVCFFGVFVKEGGDPSIVHARYHSSVLGQTDKIVHGFHDLVSSSLSTARGLSMKHVKSRWELFTRCVWNADLSRDEGCQTECTDQNLRDFEEIFGFNPRAADAGELTDLTDTFRNPRSYGVYTPVSLITLGEINGSSFFDQ